MGIRHGFGLFLQPMSADLHWGRETFALAIAVQNLVWGVTAPFAGMFADRFGTHRVALVCALLYSAGLATMALATTPLTLILAAGVLIGTGLSGLTVLGRRRRARPRVSAGKAQHGARHLGGRGIVRPVRAAAGDAVADFAHRLVRRPVRARGRRAADDPAVGVAVRAAPRDRTRVPAVGGAGDARGARPPRLHAAYDRLLRLRLPGRVRRRAPARVSRRQGAWRRTSRSPRSR